MNGWQSQRSRRYRSLSQLARLSIMRIPLYGINYGPGLMSLRRVWDSNKINIPRPVEPIRVPND